MDQSTACFDPPATAFSLAPIAVTCEATGETFPSLYAAAIARDVSKSVIRRAIRTGATVAGSRWSPAGEKPVEHVARQRGRGALRLLCEADGLVYESVNHAAATKGVSASAISHAMAEGRKCAGSTWVAVAAATPVTAPVLDDDFVAPAGKYLGGRQPRPVRCLFSGLVYGSIAIAAAAVGATAVGMRQGIARKGTVKGRRYEYAEPGAEPTYHPPLRVRTTARKRRGEQRHERSAEEIRDLFAEYESKVRMQAAVFCKRRWFDGTVTFDDAYSDGCLGLMSAITRPFDIDGDASFNVWAERWIVRAMKNGASARRAEQINAAAAGSRVSSFEDLGSNADDADPFESTLTRDRPSRDASYAEMTACLDERDADLFALRFVHDRTPAEIAAELNMHPDSITKRFASGLAAIRSRLADAYGEGVAA